MTWRFSRILSHRGSFIRFSRIRPNQTNTSTYTSLNTTITYKASFPYPIFGDEGDAGAGHPSLSPADPVARGPRPRPAPRRARTRTRDAERGTVDESLLKAPEQRNFHTQDQHLLMSSVYSCINTNSTSTYFAQCKKESSSFSNRPFTIN